MAETFSYKFPTESISYTFDFSQVLSNGETISSASTSVLVRDGTDASPSSILGGSPTYSGTMVAQRVTGGLSEVTYRLVVTITTNLSNTFVALGDLPVYAPVVVQ